MHWVLTWNRHLSVLVFFGLYFYTLETLLVVKISGTQTIKYSLSSEVSSQGSQQPAIISCSDPENPSLPPLTLLTEDSSGALANQSLKATTSLVTFIPSSLGLAAANKATHKERTYLNFIFGKCTNICRLITILLQIGKVMETLDVGLQTLVTFHPNLSLWCVLLVVQAKAEEKLTI